jgi:hypothetical protein
MKTPTTLGLWIDDPVSKVLRPSYFDRLTLHGVREIAVMVDTTERGWDPKYSEKRIAVLGELCRTYDIALVLTTWPDPHPPSLRSMAKGVDKLLKASGASGWEVDTEFNWRHNRITGFRRKGKKSAMDLAGDLLVKLMHEQRAKHDVWLELTTFAMHTENGRAADVAQHMDRLCVQAYSVHNRNRNKIPWSHAYGPGNMQKFTFDRTLLVPGVNKTQPKPKIVAGLAAYDQKWPGKHTAREALTAAMDTTLEYTDHVRYWSSKWVLGVRANRYASAYLKELELARG